MAGWHRYHHQFVAIILRKRRLGSEQHVDRPRDMVSSFEEAACGMRRDGLGRLSAEGRGVRLLFCRARLDSRLGGLAQCESGWVCIPAAEIGVSLRCPMLRAGPRLPSQAMAVSYGIQGFSAHVARHDSTAATTPTKQAGMKHNFVSLVASRGWPELRLVGLPLRGRHHLIGPHTLQARVPVALQSTSRRALGQYSGSSTPRRSRG